MQSPVWVVGKEVGGVHEEAVQGETLLTQGLEDIFLYTMDGGRGEDRVARNHRSTGCCEAVR